MNKHLRLSEWVNDGSESEAKSAYSVYIGIQCIPHSGRSDLRIHFLKIIENTRTPNVAIQFCHRAHLSVKKNHLLFRL